MSDEENLLVARTALERAVNELNAASIALTLATEKKAKAEQDMTAAQSAVDNHLPSARRVVGGGYGHAGHRQHVVIQRRTEKTIFVRRHGDFRAPLMQYRKSRTGRWEAYPACRSGLDFLDGVPE